MPRGEAATTVFEEEELGLLAPATRADGLLDVHARSAPPTAGDAPPWRECARLSWRRFAARTDTRHYAALMTRQRLLKCRGWQQTLAELLLPVLLMLCLVLGARLAEITTTSRGVYSNATALERLTGSGRYAAATEYFDASPLAACATASQLVAAAAPGFAAAAGVNASAAAGAAKGYEAATAALLAAFNTTPAALSALEDALASSGGLAPIAGPLLAAAGASLGGSGVDTRRLAATASAVAASPLDASSWSALADAAVATALQQPRGGGTGGSGDGSAAGSAVSSLLSYSGPIPIPSFDEFVAGHLLIKGVFSRFEPAWAAYDELRSRFGLAPLGNMIELGGVACAFSPSLCFA